MSACLETASHSWKQPRPITIFRGNSPRGFTSPSTSGTLAPSQPLGAIYYSSQHPTLQPQINGLTLFSPCPWVPPNNEPCVLLVSLSCPSPIHRTGGDFIEQLPAQIHVAFFHPGRLLSSSRRWRRQTQTRYLWSAPPDRAERDALPDAAGRRVPIGGRIRLGSAKAVEYPLGWAGRFLRFVLGRISSRKVIFALLFFHCA